VQTLTEPKILASIPNNNKHTTDRRSISAKGALGIRNVASGGANDVLITSGNSSSSSYGTVTSSSLSSGTWSSGFAMLPQPSHVHSKSSPLFTSLLYSALLIPENI
jgi:hypothetical protein